MLLRVVRVARCIHYTWTTMHDSFLRRVTSDLYISGSYWPCARVSSHSLWSRDATQPMRCDATFATRQPTPVHTYAPHYYVTTTVCCVPRRRKGTCRVCNVAGRSYDCRPSHRPVPFADLALPFSCRIRGPPRVSCSVSPARINGRDCGRNSFRCLLLDPIVLRLRITLVMRLIGVDQFRDSILMIDSSNSNDRRS